MIRMTGITKIYPSKAPEGPLRVLEDVALHICPGEYSALIGASGSGKSTLMHIIGCLDSPTFGHYFLDGVDVSSLRADELCRIRREKIGFVFQGFQLFQKLTALENVEYPLMLRGVPEAKRRQMALDALDMVRLARRKDHRPSQLSGGQQQRVAMARALCYQPRLLLCDEPTGALDPASRDDMLSLFDALHQDGHTIVLITHDLGVAARAQTRYQVTDGHLIPCN
ncbi:MAG: ABC transporter ATP-binding protein [Clostridia bacterium]|nr:ABC transporter ATP-binding protein [Clostridia bacterium]